MKGILFINLGSPDSTSVPDVRIYLREFLSDKYVIDSSWLMRKFLVECIILPRRPQQSAKAYQSIWWDEGSPLVVISKRFTEKAAPKIKVPVALAMRYGNPSIEKGLLELKKQGVTNVLLVPLYPQYAMSTVTTVVEKAKEIQQKLMPEIKLETLPVWYNHPEYIEVLANSIQQKITPKDYVLFSYHGVPHSHIYKTDVTKSHCQINEECCAVAQTEVGKKAQSVCYRHQCRITTELVAEKLGLPKVQYGISFQSRLGNQPWLQPATDATLEKLAQEGKKQIAVVCPAFVSDCLETLEEISEEGKETYLHSGGEKFTYIDCLNDQKEWVDLMVKWCDEWLNK